MRRGTLTNFKASTHATETIMAPRIFICRGCFHSPVRPIPSSLPAAAPAQDPADPSLLLRAVGDPPGPWRRVHHLSRRGRDRPAGRGGRPPRRAPPQPAQTPGGDASGRSPGGSGASPGPPRRGLLVLPNARGHNRRLLAGCACPPGHRALASQSPARAVLTSAPPRRHAGSAHLDARDLLHICQNLRITPAPRKLISNTFWAAILKGSGASGIVTAISADV
jgi:hypothetical protein